MINIKKIKHSTVQIEAESGYPSFEGAYITWAEYVDGPELTEEELDLLNEELDYVYEIALDKLV